MESYLASKVPTYEANNDTKVPKVLNETLEIWLQYANLQIFIERLGALKR